MAAVDRSLLLRQARIGKGWSVQTAAEVANVSLATLKRWEAGKGLPQIRSIKGYVASLGLSSSDLETGQAGPTAQRILLAKRRRADWTLAQISARTLTSISCLQRYEQGLRAMDEEVALRIGRAYGCSEAELGVMTGRVPVGPGDILPLFLTPGSAPHACLYSRLDAFVSGIADPTAVAALDILHGFMVMGDHAEAIAAWHLMEPFLCHGALSRHDRAVAAVTLALARATTCHDMRPGQTLLSVFDAQREFLPLKAMSHMSRLAALGGNPALAWQWNTLLKQAARDAGESGQVFVSLLQEADLQFVRKTSDADLVAFQVLDDMCEVPLQTYTLAVARLRALCLMGQFDAGVAALVQIRHLEALFGFGSPTAAQISRLLARKLPRASVTACLALDDSSG